MNPATVTMVSLQKEVLAVKIQNFGCPAYTPPHTYEQLNCAGSREWVSSALRAHALFSLQQAINYAAFKDDFLKPWL